MPSGAVALKDFPGDVVELACERCGRRGRYGKARLVAEHGPDVGLPDLRARLAAGCRLVGRHFGNETCGAVFPALAVIDPAAR